MTDDTIQQASDFLWATWTRGELVPALPDGLRPAHRRDGYAIQSRLEARSSRPLFGWKIAATSTAGQAHIAVDGPIAGRLLAERVVAPGGTVSLRSNRMKVAEPEFAFRIGTTLAPRDRPYAVDEVVAAVATLHPAIEIPDSRYSDFTRVGAPQLIADDACADWVVIGPAAPADWRTLDLAAWPVRGVVAGRYQRDGQGANVLGDPRRALTWLANELSGLGIGLAAGQTVITGTCMTPLELQDGDMVDADFGHLGRVSVRIDRPSGPLAP